MTRAARPRGKNGRGTHPKPPWHVRANLALWERQSDAYDRRHRGALGGRWAAAWGVWRIPESRLRLLGATRGRRTLEVGCGAGRWSIALARSGAQAVGLDISPRQLSKARHLARSMARGPRWVRGDAERLPFRDGLFDVVFADWGAMSFCDPRRTVPEASRVLRPGGRLVFATGSPFRNVTQARRGDGVSRTLRYDYFGLCEIRYQRPTEVNFQLPYGEWIRLFRSCGFRIESLTEPPTPTRGSTTYLRPAEQRWGRRWPVESIWQVVKEARVHSRRMSATKSGRASSART
jgi:SAM-dependent methyltransferase